VGAISDMTSLVPVQMEARRMSRKIRSTGKTFV
jgi:hypothetical protein